MAPAVFNMLVIVPARLGSTRLPEKALAQIGRDPLVVHCWRRAVEADVGQVWVATDSMYIGGIVAEVGGNAVITSESSPCGTDRVAQAAALVDPDGKHSHVLNVQGDMPFVAPALIRQVALALKTTKADIVTAAHRGEFVSAGHDFKRQPARRHIGIYGFHRDALESFAATPQSPREIDERLEQLRAFAAGLRIEVIDAETFPLEINTPSDLAEARQIAECLA